MIPTSIKPSFSLFLLLRQGLNFLILDGLEIVSVLWPLPPK